MTRWTAIAALVVVAGLGALGVLAGYVLDRDRDAAEQELARDRLDTLTGAARTLGGDLAGIGNDLALAAALIEQAPSAESAERELRAIAAVKHQYLALETRTPGRSVQIAATGASEQVRAAAAPVIDRMIDVARGAPDELHISRGLSDRDDLVAWYRVFARASRDRSVVAAVIDMRLLVAPPELLRSGPSRLLVMSAHGVPAPSSDPAMAELAKTGELAELLEDARARRAGSRDIDAATARELGLPDVPAVAAAVPIPIDAGTPWVLMLVTSTVSLDARHHALARRIAIGAALGLLLVAAATLYVVRNARRSAALHERLRAEDRLIRSEKLATAGQLAAGIAHEIGTPLGVARGRAEMTLLRGQTDDADTRNLRTIIERIDHVSRLIQQLLDYLRPQGTQVRAVDASRSLHVVAELLEPQAASRAVTLAVAEADAVPTLRADPGQLQQILVNLVMNAIDACEPGGSVTMRASARAGAVVLEVVDDGRGIPPEDRAHVFDPFFTTKKRGQGTGLGLWVVAQLARAHDAEIEVDSKLGAGSTFRVVWPS